MATLGEMLGQTDLFSAVQPAHREQIARAMEPRAYRAGEEIVREGDAGDAMYLVLSGRVAVVVRSQDLGASFELARLGPGDHFGEMALLTAEPRTASVVALEETRAVALSKVVFDKLLAQLPQVATAVARSLAVRLSHLERERGGGVGARTAVPAAPRSTELPARPTTLPAPVVRVRPQDIAFLAAGDERDDRASSLPAPDAVQLLAQIVAEALAFGASDVHVEADRHELVVRYRIEGSLRRSEWKAPRAALRPLVSRIKVLAGLDVAESRLPQNGRIGVTAGSRELDLRVATIPARLGEKVALRILDTATAIQPLGQIIVADKMAVALRKCLFRPYGAVILTGPTGSGKTTTLYSALAERTSQGVQLNVMTAEDPVEYSLPGVTQVQIHEAAGLTYPEVLRAFLRQDPDILVIGETRDAATARIALEAALTGHLVLTTMHTNDAMSAVVRLREMGMEPFLVSNALLAVVAQRLVRRLCPACRKPGTYPPAVLETLAAVGALRPGDEASLFDAVGCEQCGGSGFRGRVGVFEMLLFDERVRQAVAEDRPLASLRPALEGTGFVSLGRYAAYLLKAGLTVPGEVLRAVRVEQQIPG
ncbi:MAG: Flp pilus assembly complex ATPase component TadA [Myxococcales bacterium]|nr:Flp pilus assembly complex ATPase component TadA [Myxococcales bacterium]